jgi:hypothetical protein
MWELSSRKLMSLVPITVLACVLSACGSGTPESSESEQLGVTEEKGSASSSQDFSIDNGFDPMVDGFNFENWGAKGELDATAMVALFGAKSVCAERTSSGCVLFPAAKQWAKQVNEAMKGGICEGMAVMAERLFGGDEQLEDLDPNAGSTYDLAFKNREVRAQIAMWYATQMLAPVQKNFAAYQKLQPSEIAEELALGLESGRGHTMGIYSEYGGHAVNPFAVTQKGNQIVVDVYDNNYPGSVQEILIDRDTETWIYEAASTNPAEEPSVWTGGQGTIELTAMDSRTLPAKGSFVDKGLKRAALDEGVYELMLTSSDPTARVAATITVDGVDYDTMSLTEQLPPGVTARSILGSALSGKGMTLKVDKNLVEAFTVTPRLISENSQPAFVTMSIDSYGEPRATLSGLSSQASGAAFTVDETEVLWVQLPDGALADLNVAYGLNSVDFIDLEETEGGYFTVATNDVGDALVELFNEEGDQTFEYDVEFDSSSEEVEYAEFMYDEAEQSYSVSVIDAKAESVDWDFVEEARESEGPDDVASSSDETSAEPDSGAEPDPGSDSGAEPDPGSDSGAEPDPDSDSGAEPDPDSDSGAEPDPGADQDDGNSEEANRQEEPEGNDPGDPDAIE